MSSHSTNGKIMATFALDKKAYGELKETIKRFMLQYGKFTIIGPAVILDRFLKEFFEYPRYSGVKALYYQPRDRQTVRGQEVRRDLAWLLYEEYRRKSIPTITNDGPPSKHLRSSGFQPESSDYNDDMPSSVMAVIKVYFRYTDPDSHTHATSQPVGYNDSVYNWHDAS